MLGAKRAVWLCHTSDSQQRSAPEAGESNVQLIPERTLSPTKGFDRLSPLGSYHQFWRKQAMAQRKGQT